MIEVLIGAWLLSLLGFDDLFIKGVYEWTGKEITIAGYYVFFAVVALIYELLKVIKGEKE